MLIIHAFCLYLLLSNLVLETHTNVAYVGDKINNNESGYRIGAPLIENGIDFEKKESCYGIGGYSGTNVKCIDLALIDFEYFFISDQYILFIQN